MGATSNLSLKLSIMTKVELDNLLKEAKRTGSPWLMDKWMKARHKYMQKMKKSK